MYTKSARYDCRIHLCGYQIWISEIEYMSTIKNFPHMFILRSDNSKNSCKHSQLLQFKFSTKSGFMSEREKYQQSLESSFTPGRWRYVQ